MDELKVERMIKHCIVYIDRDKIIVPRMFTQDNGPLKLGQATILNIKFEFDKLGKVVIDTLNMFDNFKMIDIPDEKFFSKNLKNYGYSSYSVFHKKVEFCAMIEFDGKVVKIIPAQKDKHGFEDIPDKIKICKPDDQQITRQILNMYTEETGKNLNP